MKSSLLTSIVLFSSFSMASALVDSSMVSIHCRIGERQKDMTLTPADPNKNPESVFAYLTDDESASMINGFAFNDPAQNRIVFEIDDYDATDSSKVEFKTEDLKSMKEIILSAKIKNTKTLKKEQVTCSIAKK
jgi:hypothetical protein